MLTLISEFEMKKVEDHIYGKDSKKRVKGAKRIIRNNRTIQEKRRPNNMVFLDFFEPFVVIDKS